MGKRITLMIDDDLDKKIRYLQAQAIRNTHKAVSYSEIINQILREKSKKI